MILNIVKDNINQLKEIISRDHINSTVEELYRTALLGMIIRVKSLYNSVSSSDYKTLTSRVTTNIIHIVDMLR